MSSPETSSEMRNQASDYPGDKTDLDKAISGNVAITIMEHKAQLHERRARALRDEISEEIAKLATQADIE